MNHSADVINYRTHHFFETWIDPFEFIGCSYVFKPKYLYNGGDTNHYNISTRLVDFNIFDAADAVIYVDNLISAIESFSISVKDKIKGSKDYVKYTVTRMLDKNTVNSCTSGVAKLVMNREDIYIKLHEKNHQYYNEIFYYSVGFDLKTRSKVVNEFITRLKIILTELKNFKKYLIKQVGRF